MKRSMAFPWGLRNIKCIVQCSRYSKDGLHQLLHCLYTRTAPQQDQGFISSYSELKLALWLWPIECGKSNILGLPSPGLMRTGISAFFLFKLFFLETSWRAIRKPKQPCGKAHGDNWGAHLSSQSETSANYWPPKWSHFRPAGHPSAPEKPCGQPIKSWAKTRGCLCKPLHFRVIWHPLKSPLRRWETYLYIWKPLVAWDSKNQVKRTQADRNNYILPGCWCRRNWDHKELSFWNIHPHLSRKLV